MGFNNAFTAVTGAVYTAAQYNTYTRDNLTAIWVGTTAGDLDYYTGAAAKTRLALITGGLLRGGASGPEWMAHQSGGLLWSTSSAPAWLSHVPGGLLYGGASGPAYLSNQAGGLLRGGASGPEWMAHQSGGLLWSTSSAPAWLSHVPGGLLYGGTDGPAYLSNQAGGLLHGGASNPAWLAPPAGVSLLQHNGATPSHLAIGAAGAFLKTNSAGTAFQWAGFATASHSNATGHSYATSTERDMPNSSATITPGVQSTILVVATVLAACGAGNCFFDYAININGTNGAFSSLRYSGGIGASVVAVARLTGVAAGAKTIKLRETQGYGGGVAYDVVSLAWLAIAIPE